MNTKPIGYYSGYGMIYIMEIIHGIEDLVVYTVGTNPKLRRAKIYYKEKGDYFYHRGCKIPFSEIIRC